MSHYSGRLETELASGILRAEQTSFTNSQGFFISASRSRGVRRYRAVSSRKSLRIGRTGRVPEDNNKKVSWKIPYFLIWEFPSSFKD